MSCLISLMLTGVPRLILLFIWLFTARVQVAFDGFIMPLLGFIFLPFTTLAYVLFYDPVGGMNAASWIFTGFALLIDVGALTASAYANKSRIPARGDV